MQAEGDQCQQLENVVTPAYMVLLMQQDIRPLCLSQRRWEIDFGPHQSQHEGRRNVIGQVDVLLEMCRADQASSQA